MSTTQINVRIDNQLKNEVELIFDKLGINTADAIRIFLKKVKSENGIPFSLKLEKKVMIIMNQMRKPDKLYLMDDNIHKNRIKIG